MSENTENSQSALDAESDEFCEEEFLAEECSMFQGQDEHDALAAVFDDVRTQSADGQLVEPTRWPAIGLVPEHLTSDEFEMLVYEYLEESKADQAERDAIAAAEKPVYRSATKTVGVPRLFAQDSLTEIDSDSDLGLLMGDAEARPVLDAEACPVLDGDVDGDGEMVQALNIAGDAALSHAVDGGPAGDIPEESPVDSAEGSADPGPLRSGDEATESPQSVVAEELGVTIPSGFELVELEGEWTLVPFEDVATPIEIQSNNIVVMMGVHSYYLYSRDFMTDAYARWSFLAVEDDRVATFVECVRNESRTYPRPMAATGLQNEPFNLTEAEVEETWQAVSGSGAYPDIGMTVASNGEVYYYSTEYLTDPYAASLAEWHAVEREMYL